MAAKQFTDLAVGSISPSRWQPRAYPYDGDAFEELKRSIQQHGVLDRVRVFVNEKGEHEIIAGHRRVSAADAVKCDKVPVEITLDLRGKDGKETASLLRKLHGEVFLDNLYHEDLTPIEEAKGIQDLLQDERYTQQEIGHVLGKSQQWVSDRLALLKLAPAIQTAVTGRAVEVTVAKDLARLPEAAQMPVMKHLQRSRATSRQAAETVKHIQRAVEPGFWDLPADAPVSEMVINTKRVLDYWLAQVPEDRMGEVLAALEVEGLLLPPHRFPSHRTHQFAQACGAERVDWGYWKAFVTEQGYACENCVWDGAGLYWPCDQEERVVCQDHFLMESDPCRLPCLGGVAECDDCWESPGWCADVGCRIEETKKRRTAEADGRDEQEEARIQAAQERTKTFYEDQKREGVDREHWLAQACDSCALFQGAEDPDQLCADPKGWAGQEFWRKTGKGETLLVPRCRGYRIRDVATLPAIKTSAFTEILVAWIHELATSRWTVLTWMPEEKAKIRAALKAWLEDGTLNQKQVASLVTMAINDDMGTPDTWSNRAVKRIDPVTGGYSAWKLEEREGDSEEAEAEMPGDESPIEDDETEAQETEPGEDAELGEDAEVEEDDSDDEDGDEDEDQDDDLDDDEYRDFDPVDEMDFDPEHDLE